MPSPTGDARWEQLRLTPEPAERRAPELPFLTIAEAARRVRCWRANRASRGLTVAHCGPAGMGRPQIAWRLPDPPRRPGSVGVRRCLVGARRRRSARATACSRTGRPRRRGRCAPRRVGPPHPAVLHHARGGGLRAGSRRAGARRCRGEVATAPVVPVVAHPRSSVLANEQQVLRATAALGLSEPRAPTNCATRAHRCSFRSSARQSSNLPPSSAMPRR